MSFLPPIFICLPFRILFPFIQLPKIGTKTVAWREVKVGQMSWIKRAWSRTLYLAACTLRGDNGSAPVRRRVYWLVNNWAERARRVGHKTEHDNTLRYVLLHFPSTLSYWLLRWLGGRLYCPHTCRHMFVYRKKLKFQLTHGERVCTCMYTTIISSMLLSQAPFRGACIILPAMLSNGTIFSG